MVEPIFINCKINLDQISFLKKGIEIGLFIRSYDATNVKIKPKTIMYFDKDVEREAKVSTIKI